GARGRLPPGNGRARLCGERSRAADVAAGYRRLRRADDRNRFPHLHAAHDHSRDRTADLAPHRAAQPCRFEAAGFIERLTMANTSEGRTLSVALADWWRGWRQSGNGVAELQACGSEVRQIADDLGLSPGELRVIAAKRPDAADLLTARLTGLHLDA